MHCVQCTGYKLEPVEISDGLIVAQCQKCSGISLSLLNYRFWAKNKRVPESPVDASAELRPEVVEDQASAKQCSKCSRLMVKYRLAAGVNNRLDYCSACNDVWMDNGEWELFVQLNLPVELPQVLTSNWQAAIREQQRADKEKQFYIDLLGEDDFNKLFAFKQWLLQHPKKEQLKHYISIND